MSMSSAAAHTQSSSDTPRGEAQFTAGDLAVYPAHGVVEVVEVETKVIGGQEIAFFGLQVKDSGLKINVPVNKARAIGMRPVANGADLEKLDAILADRDVPIDRQTWNRRYRGFMEKIRTGSLFEVAEVFRDLCMLRSTKTLSHGEREMLRTAKDLLVKEVAVARDAPEETVAEQLESMF